MSYLDIYNAMQLEDARADAKNSAQIAELGQRAEHIHRTTGNRPDNWYEYKLKHEKPLKLHPVRNAIIGALVGAAASVVLMATVAAVVTGGAAILTAGQLGLLAVGGAAIGSLIGKQLEVSRENVANAKLANGYSDYLGDFHKSHQISQSAGINYRDDHAQRVREQSQQHHAPAR